MDESALITTKRLLLLPTEKLTLSQIRTLDDDPDIMKYISNGLPRTVEESKKWLQIKLADYKKNGFGMMPAFQKKDHQFIGWGGLKYLEDTSKIELGYRLNKPYWGKGYATEISKAIIFYARTHLNVKQLVAVTDLKNENSKKVLLKSGFKYLSEGFYYNTTVDYFEIQL